MTIIGAIALFILGTVILKYGDRNVGNTFMDRVPEFMGVSKERTQNSRKLQKWLIGVCCFAFGIYLLILSYP
jgi:hypothetical protein